jgi:hypothetical protein
MNNNHEFEPTLDQDKNFGNLKQLKEIFSKIKEIHDRHHIIKNPRIAKDFEQNINSLNKKLEEIKQLNQSETSQTIIHTTEIINQLILRYQAELEELTPSQLAIIVERAKEGQEILSADLGLTMESKNKLAKMFLVADGVGGKQDGSDTESKIALRQAVKTLSFKQSFEKLEIATNELEFDQNIKELVQAICRVQINRPKN